MSDLMSVVAVPATNAQPIVATNALDFSFLPPSFIQEMKDKAEHNARYKMCMVAINALDTQAIPAMELREMRCRRARRETLDRLLNDIYNDHDTNKIWTGPNMTDARMYMRLLRQLEYTRAVYSAVFGNPPPHNICDCSITYKHQFNPIDGYRRRFSHQRFVSQEGWKRLKKEPKEVVAVVKY